MRWTVIGSTVVSGNYNDRETFVKQAVNTFYAKLLETIVPTVRNIVAEDDRVVVQWEGRALGKNGSIYYQTFCYVLRMAEGIVREGTAYLDTEGVTKLLK